MKKSNRDLMAQPFYGSLATSTDGLVGHLNKNLTEMTARDTLAKKQLKNMQAI